MIDLPPPPPEFGTCLRVWRRQALALAAVASGRCLAVEICEILAAARGFTRPAGSRIISEVVAAGLLADRVLSMHLVGGRSPVHLRVLELTAAGRRCTEACGWPAQLTEWDRLRGWHEAERYPEHALAILFFLREARWRGRSATVCGPEHTPRPDVWVDDGYVEVERRRGSPGKWTANARLNGGVVQVCTLNAMRRHALIGDIQALGLPGRATDLRTLLHHRDDTTLWLEQW